MTSYNSTIPAIRGSDHVIELSIGKSVVFVGANGSGKSRLGCYLERQMPEKVHRIPAHKSLSFPDSISPGNFDEDIKELWYGRNGLSSNKIITKYKQNPETHSLNDYTQLVKTLISQSYEIAVAHLRKHREDRNAVPPSTIIMDLIKIWQNVLPHRRLKEVSASVRVSNPDGTKNDYSASELSDGERAIFYFIGQCLLAPEKGIIIVDEPELHIHKSILKKLWDEIEASRPDCAFVYITHDLEFAKSRTASRKYAIQDYKSNKWNIIPVPESNEFPEEIITKIIGSRHPILFVEGTGQSVDINVYGKVYSEFTLIPLGSAEAVIHAIASFSSNPALHNIHCVGIIDGDDRTEDDIQNLSKKGIYVLPVSEIENILLHEDLLRIISHSLKYSKEQTNEKVAEAKELAFKQAAEVLDSCCLTFVKRRIDNYAKKIDLTGKSLDDLQRSLERAVKEINPKEIYNERVSQFQKAIESKDYDAIIKIYDKKGLSSQIGSVFGLKSGEYVELILRALNSSDDNEIHSFLKSQLPVIQIVAPVKSKAT